MGIMKPGGSPQLIILGGPNGAGKSTSAPRVLPGDISFLNADTIAMSLPGGHAPGNDLPAGRQYLETWKELVQQRSSVSIETTLAGRSLASRIGRIKRSGYTVQLIYFWLENAGLAVARVEERVRRGGHSIPEATIRRRYVKSIINLLDLYIPLSDVWLVYNNSDLLEPQLIASGSSSETQIAQPDLWEIIQKGSAHDVTAG